MKIFAPPLDTVWRFLADWTPPESFMTRMDNEEPMFGSTHSADFTAYCKTDPHPQGSYYGTKEYADWTTRWRAWRAQQLAARRVSVIPTGTVVVFDRYHISHSGDHAITLRLLASPELRLHPKKQKGKLRGSGRIYLHVEELNTFPEIEHVEDFQAG